MPAGSTLGESDDSGMEAYWPIFGKPDESGLLQLRPINLLAAKFDAVRSLQRCVLNAQSSYRHGQVEP